MSTEDTIRFLHHEAHTCRDRDRCEAFCLLLPALVKLLDLQPMDDAEAAAFSHQFKNELRQASNGQPARV